MTKSACVAFVIGSLALHQIANADDYFVIGNGRVSIDLDTGAGEFQGFGFGTPGPLSFSGTSQLIPTENPLLAMYSGLDTQQTLFGKIILKAQGEVTTVPLGIDKFTAIWIGDWPITDGTGFYEGATGVASVLVISLPFSDPSKQEFVYLKVGEIFVDRS